MAENHQGKKMFVHGWAGAILALQIIPTLLPLCTQHLLTTLC